MQEKESLPSGSIYDRLRNLPQPVKEALLKGFWPLKGLWECWQDYSAEMAGHIPSHAFRLGWYRGINRMKIGAGSSIHRNCRMYFPHRIKIGEHTVINYGVLLDGRSGLRIGDNVSISEGTAILTLGHDIDDPQFGLKGGEVVIEDYVFIGAYARVLPGVRLEEGAVAAAGSVVTKDVAAYTVVGGAPAVFLRERSREVDYKLDYRKTFVDFQVGNKVCVILSP